MSGRIGRNDPCPCGSGLKVKKCCLSAKAVAIKSTLDEIQDISEIMDVMSDTKHWNADQLAAMKKRFPSCVICDGELNYVRGECGTWVHFGDAVPDDEDDYLVTDGKIVASAIWQFDGLHFECPSYAEDDFAMQVTHWMRYPDPPQS